MAESNTPLSLRVPLCLPSFHFFSPLFPFFSPLFPFFFLLLSQNPTHRYREIAFSFSSRGLSKVVFLDTFKRLASIH